MTAHSLKRPRHAESFSDFEKTSPRPAPGLFHEAKMGSEGIEPPTNSV